MLAAAVLFALTGCFEEPVEESVHLDFAGDGRVEITFRRSDGRLVETEAARLLLSEQERRSVAAVGDAMDELLAILLIDEGQAFTLNELSRRVYDPFPGTVTVSPGGEVTEAVGFVQHDGRWRVPRHDLWSAFSALEGRWVSPDPARAYVAASLASDLDLDALLAGGLTTAPAPTPAEVREALEAGLAPEPVYRIAWRDQPNSR